MDSDRAALALVTVVGAVAPLAVAGWSWASAAATVAVGASGLLVSWRADRRAARAEDRAEEAERRSQEAHGWELEKRAEESAAREAEAGVRAWVAARRAVHGNAYHTLDLMELAMARAARDLRLVGLKELHGSEGAVVDAMVRVLE